MSSDKKRREPQEPTAVEAGGVRFEAPLLGVPLGYAQDGGIVTARDAASGELLWSQRVYAIPHDGTIEDDKQDVFVTALELASDGQALEICNEHGQRFRLGLHDRRVDPLGSAVT
jgi:hypothetical protein